MLYMVANSVCHLISILIDDPVPCGASYRHPVLHLQECLREIYSSVRAAHDKTALSNLRRRFTQHRVVKYKVGDWAIVWCPAASEDPRLLD